MEDITNKPTADFIAAHLNDDVRTLALKVNRNGDIDIDFALRQIAGWQTAKRKLPSWTEVKGLLFPPHLSMEQCSGEPAAEYKRRLSERLTQGNEATIGVDLTGGFGVDFSFMARSYHHAVYVERQEELCRIVSHNLPLLGVTNAKVVCDEAEHFISAMQHAHVIYLDPARRDAHGARTYSISDCTPDVMVLLPQLMAKSRHIIIKLSPMLDWTKTISDLGSKVSEVHIVSTGGECRDLLIVIDSHRQQKDRPDIYCVADHEMVMISPEMAAMPLRIVSAPYQEWAGTYLYEPHTSLMKSGCWGAISSMYDMEMISANSHLFISAKPVVSFPGRSFMIDEVSTMNKRELKSMIGTMAKANISVRNFPLTAKQLRLRLKMGDGGDNYLFATTTDDGRHVIMKCSKITRQDSY